MTDMDAVRSADSRIFAIVLRVIIYLFIECIKNHLDDAAKASR